MPLVSSQDVLIFALVAYILVQSILIRKDALSSVRALGAILHQAQEDSKTREEESKARERDAWQRANVESELLRAQLHEAHRRVLASKGRAAPPEHPGQNVLFNRPPPREVATQNGPKRSELAGMR